MPNLILKGSHLTSNEVAALMQGIKEDGNELEVFSLTLEEIQIDELALLLGVLNDAPNLQELHLMITNAGGARPLDSQLITSYLKKLLQTKDLRAFSLNLAGCETAPQWLEFLRNFTSVKELNLEFCRIRDEEFANLLQIVTQSQQLSSLNLYASAVGDRNLAILLREFLRTSPQRGLLKLNLCNTRLNSESMEVLASLLPHAESLDLSHNQIDDQNIAPFLHALRTNLSLTYLNIDENNLHHDGAQKELQMVIHANNVMRQILRATAGDDRLYPELELVGCDSARLTAAEKAEASAQAADLIFENRELISQITRDSHLRLRLLQLAATERNQLLFARVFEFCSPEMVGGFDENIIKFAATINTRESTEFFSTTELTQEQLKAAMAGALESNNEQVTDIIFAKYSDRIQPIFTELVERYLADTTGEKVDKYISRISLEWIRDPVYLVGAEGVNDYYERQDLVKAVGLRNPLTGEGNLAREDIFEPSADFIASLASTTNFLKGSPEIAKRLNSFGNQELAVKLLTAAEKFLSDYFKPDDRASKADFEARIEEARTLIRPIGRTSPVAADAAVSTKATQFVTV